MELDTTDDRYELVEILINEASEFEESIADNEDDFDWGGAMTTVENLSALLDMIRMEEIFTDILNDIDEVRTRDSEEKKIYMDITNNNLKFFIRTVFMYRLNHTLDNLESWGFRTEDGIKFKESFCDRLGELKKTYEKIYDL